MRATPRVTAPAPRASTRTTASSSSAPATTTTTGGAGTTAPQFTGPYPAGTPSWIESLLDELYSAGDLYGITPTILASVAKGESGFETAGAAINSSGYGGYYGLSTTPYKTIAGTEQVTAATLNTNSPTSFVTQTEVEAALLAQWIHGTPAAGVPGDTVDQALNTGDNGPGGKNTNSIDEEIYQQTIGVGKSGTATLTSTTKEKTTTRTITILTPGSLAGGVTTVAKTGATAAATGVAGAVESFIGDLIKPFEDAIFVVMGIILVIVGLVLIAHAAKSGTSTDTNPFAGPSEQERAYVAQRQKNEASFSSMVQRYGAGGTEDQKKAKGGGLAADAEEVAVA